MNNKYENNVAAVVAGIVPHFLKRVFTALFATRLQIKID
jgi:hypothetical protein